MAENRTKDCGRQLYYCRSWKRRHRLVDAKQGASAKLKRRARRASLGWGRCAMMLAIAATAGRQFPVSSTGKRIRADQREAEHYHQQGCPDATHYCKCTLKTWLFPIPKGACRWAPAVLPISRWLVAYRLPIAVENRYYHCRSIGHGPPVADSVVRAAILPTSRNDPTAWESRLQNKGVSLLSKKTSPQANSFPISAE